MNHSHFINIFFADFLSTKTLFRRDSEKYSELDKTCTEETFAQKLHKNLLDLLPSYTRETELIKHL